MGRKRIRSNYYKNSAAKRRAKVIQRFLFCIKAVIVVAALQFVSFLFIFSYDFLTQCDYFNAKSIVVTGANRITKKQVLNHARVYKGINILSVNLSMARKRLLSYSWVDDVEVSRELPDKITIKIKEHRPLAILDFGRKFIINTHGEVFKEMTVSDPSNLPAIKGLEFSDINVQGKPHSAAFSAVMEVLALGQKSESVLPYNIIKGIQVDREIGLTVFTSDRIKAVKIGYDDYPNKYARLKDVLLYLRKKRDFSHLESIDLNNLNRIVVNPSRVKLPVGDHKEV
ncbi:MAG: FtsQ-type POTRA domain-containing protein [Desulfobacterales bacterium]|nr:MAG: FtsQ-type POTRA domain-containing protein [Desulfobacterales bacterium]